MLPFDENLRAKLRKEDLDKKNRKIITSSHAYKKRIHQLERIKTMKRIRRRMETPKEKSYKNERRHTRPLEADEKITTELLSCPFKGTGCSHKGFKRKKCLENHIAQKHSDETVLGLDSSLTNSPNNIHLLKKNLPINTKKTNQIQFERNPLRKKQSPITKNQ